MARSLRIEYAGATYHITSRGNERKKILKNNKDKEIKNIKKSISNVKS